MMKKRAAAICLAGALALGTCTVSAANGTRDISATFRNIKIVVDGKEISTSAEPFIYNGTTYLPIRAVGEAVGKEVTWDGSTNTVYLGEVPAGAGQAQVNALQTSATSAPAATDSFPIFYKYEDKLVLDEGLFLSGDPRMVIEIYVFLIEYCITYAGNYADAKAAYAEAQTAFASIASHPDCAAIKAEFEEIYQAKFLPYLN